MAGLSSDGGSSARSCVSGSDTEWEAAAVASEPPEPQQQQQQQRREPPGPDDGLLELQLKDLQALARAEGVRAHVGGRESRTKQDIVDDIRAARAGQVQSSCRSVAKRVVAGRRHSPEGPPPWQVPRGSAGHRGFGGLQAEKIILGQGGRSKTCFFEELFGRRCQRYELRIPSATGIQQRGEKLPPATFKCDDGCTVQLLAAKVEAGARQFFGAVEKVLSLLYVRTEGPDLPAICPATELEAVADFVALPSERKIKARLELMLSSARADRVYKGCTRQQFDVWETEPTARNGEPMADGCGFIPQELLRSILGKASDMLGVQVRIFGPRLGVYKGVLCAKPGIDKVQLPPSMRKVLPSRTEDSSEPETQNEDRNWVALMVVREFPSTASLRISKRLAGAAPPKSAQPLKPLSPMIKMLWKALKVPPDMIKAVEKKVAKDCADQAFVVGFGDPTGALPAGSVFISGLLEAAAARAENTLFVTRCPCVRPHDGQMLPMCVHRPEAMREENWDWLCKQPFGAIYFSTDVASAPMPAGIAEGDLDGDLYFVCWDAEVLEAVVPREAPLSQNSGGSQFPGAVEAAPTERTKCQAAWVREEGRWLKDAQDHMLNIAVLHETSDIGRIYKAWEKRVEEADSMDDPDALQLAAAYIKALDRGKHGGDLGLPEHLKKLAKLK